MRRYNGLNMRYERPEVKWIPLSRIDPSDSIYRTRGAWSRASPLLERLILGAGIVTPLRLEGRRDGGLRIVSGFRRFLVARRSGLDEVPALIVGGEPDQLFLSAVCENMSQTPPLDPVERADVAVRFLRDFGYPEDRVAAEILPLLELPGQPHQLRQLRELADLPEAVRHALSRRLTIESARALEAWSPADADFFLGLVERYQLGTNKQKQILELLEDLRRREQRPVREIWEESGAASVERREELAPSDRFQQFRHLLRLRRFPILGEYEERAERLQRALDLPGPVQLRLPPYFEGDHLDVVLRVSSTAELRSLLELLDALVDRDELKELFELL